jgi:hypothetical protein
MAPRRFAQVPTLQPQVAIASHFELARPADKSYLLVLLGGVIEARAERVLRISIAPRVCLFPTRPISAHEHPLRSDF